MDVIFPVALGIGLLYVLIRVARYILPQDVRRARKAKKEEQDLIEQAFYSIVESLKPRKKDDGSNSVS